MNAHAKTFGSASGEPNTTTNRPTSQQMCEKLWTLPAATKPSKRGGRKAFPKHIPVVATSNNRSTRTTLVPAGAGRYRLQVHATLRKAARADVGEIIGVSLKIDLAPRDLPVPAELEAALKSRPRLKKEFDRLTVAGRMQFLRWFSAKSPEVRKKRLPRALEVLTERALNRKTKLTAR